MSTYMPTCARVCGHVHMYVHACVYNTCTCVYMYMHCVYACDMMSARNDISCYSECMEPPCSVHTPDIDKF